jgi:large subunit ribosomal protein L15
MMIHDITVLAGKYKARKRVGRGEGSGHGKQSGRGHKGAGARSGTSAKIGFEGGQMRYFRRMPKFGFTNAAFKTKFWVVNLADILAHADFAKGGSVNAAALVKAGLVRDDSRDLKILGHLKDAKGVKVKLDVEASRVSVSAREAILSAGGKVNETGTRRDRVRGVDRNSDNKAPTKLTKKLNRGKGTKKVVVADEPAPDAKDAKGKAKK